MWVVEVKLDSGDERLERKIEEALAESYNMQVLYDEQWCPLTPVTVSAKRLKGGPEWEQLRDWHKARRGC